MVYLTLSKIFMDTDDHAARQATETERKLQTSCYDGERKGWDWDKYVALYNKKTIMDSLINNGYSGMTNVTEVFHFLQAPRALSWRQQSMLYELNKKIMD